MARHYVPTFRAVDLTGDGNPELVQEVAGGGAWGYLRVYRRAPDRYEMLLEEAGQTHTLWDADGDGLPDAISHYRTGSQADQALQRFRWIEGRFVAWYAPEWSSVDSGGQGGTVPDLRGLTLQEAQGAILGAELSLGAIAEVDTPGPAGRVVRQSPGPGRVVDRPRDQAGTPGRNRARPPARTPASPSPSPGP